MAQICADPAEFWPLRLFAFELRRWANTARDLQQAFCADLAIERHRCKARIGPRFLRIQDAPSTPEVEAAARNMGHQIRVLNVSTDTEIETAFATLTESRANALAVVGNPPGRILTVSFISKAYLFWSRRRAL
jgi:hypothetical protein